MPNYLKLPSVVSMLWLASAMTAQERPVDLPRMVVATELLTDSAATVTPVNLPVDTHLNELSSAAGRAANFFVAANGAHSFTDVFTLRGLTNTPLFGDPAVSLYLDELPLGHGFTYPTDLAGFDRLDLHRGPTQNTIYGRAGSAGVLVLSTPAPGAAPSGQLIVAAGNYGSRSLNASVSSAGGQPMEVYVNARYAVRDGYITNTTLHRDVDARESRSGLLRLRARAEGGGELTLLAMASRARDGSQPLVPLGAPFFAVTRNTEGFSQVDAWHAALTASGAVPIGRLTTTLSRSEWELGPYRSVLGFGGPADLSNDVQLRQHTWNGELKFTGPANAPALWSAGLFYSDGRTDGTFARAFGPFLFEQSDYRIGTSSLAGLGEVTWAASKQLNVTAGLRVEGSRKKLHRVEIVPVQQVFARQVAASAWLPKLGFNYGSTEDRKLFATVGAGFKPGGFSAFTGNPLLAAFGPERTKTLEAGLTMRRSSALSGTGRFFYYDITGYQIERSFATSSAADDYLVVNASRAISWGGEMELEWKPRESLSLNASIGVSHVTLREFVDPYTHVSYSGNRAPAVPAYDGSLRLAFVPKSGFEAGLELTANGRTYYTEGADLNFSQRAYCALHAKVGYSRAFWRLSFYGNNLGDTKYYTAMTPGAGHATPGAPRTYGAEWSARF